MTKNVTLIYGDGIGPEVIRSVVDIIEFLGCDINFDTQIAGLESVKKYDKPINDKLIESIRENKVALKGPVTTPVGRGFRSVNVGLRQEFNLYANVRPVKNFKGLKCRYDNVDLVVMRENTEGLYSGVERQESEDKAISERIITKKASEDIARYAFEYAKKEGRKKVTALHKANILKLTDRIFLDAVESVASEYKDIELEEMIIDAACMNIVMHPERYDILLATNLFGDIISDLCAGLIGGLGLTTGANIGKNAAIFEAVHGSAPDIAGTNSANPTACILAAGDMLSYLGLKEDSIKIKKSIEDIFKEGKCLTKDLGGNCGTKEFTREVIARLK